MKTSITIIAILLTSLSSFSLISLAHGENVDNRNPFKIYNPKLGIDLQDDSTHRDAFLRKKQNHKANQHIEYYNKRR